LNHNLGMISSRLSWFSDHFMLTADSIKVNAYECFTAMAAATAYTTKLRIGSLVFCNSYRHPPVLAKQIASLDHFSRGRIEFGYGAGWKKVEYKAYGIEFPPAKTRLEQLVEAIKIIRNLWIKDRTSFHGKHYQLHEAVSYPKPYQQPHPPIWIGTMYARPKMLNIAAEYADGINLAWAYTLEDFEKKMNMLDELCEKHNRKPSTLKRSYGIWTRVYESKEEKKRIMQEAADKRGITLEQLEKRYEGSMHGTIEEIREWLKSYSKLGVEHFIFMFPQDKEIEQMKILAEEIIPTVK